MGSRLLFCRRSVRKLQHTEMHCWGDDDVSSLRICATIWWLLHHKWLNFMNTIHQTYYKWASRSITGCSPVSERVKCSRLKFFGHLARSAQEEDHHRIVSAALRPPSDWRKPVGRPRTTWLRTIDDDVQPQNFGVHTAWTAVEEGKGQGGLGTSRQYGNALLGVRY